MPTKLSANISSSSFVTVAASNMAKTELSVTEVELDWNEIETAKEWIGKDGGVVQFNMPKNRPRREKEESFSFER